jgi:dephospho-CoA kinase
MFRTLKNQLAFVFSTSVPNPLRLALAVILGSYLLVHAVLGDWVGPYDYNHLAAYYDIAYRFWTTGQGTPGFNPFLCGGRTLAADPQIPIYHPWIALVGLVGSTWALRLELLFALFIGAVGCCRWLRWLGLNQSQVAWGTVLFLAGGGVVSKIAVGHVTLSFYFLYPLFLYLSYRLTENRGRRFRRLLFVYCAAFTYAGLYKPNFFVYGLMPLLLESLFRSYLRRSFRPAFAIGCAIGISALVQSVSALPAYSYFTRFPRPPDHPFTWAHSYSFVANLLLPLKTIPSFLYGEFLFLPHEANLFLGPVALVFAFLGLRRWQGKRAELWSLGLLFVVSFFLGLGSTAPGFQWNEPFTWFGFWPGFSSIRVPPRFWFGSFVGAIALSAAGFVITTNPWTRKLVWLLGLLPLTVFALFHIGKTLYPFQGALPTAVYAPDPLRHGFIDDNNEPLQSIRQGIGTINCTQNLQAFTAKDLREGALLDLFPQTYSGTARWKNWSSAELDLETRPGDKIQFNMNHSDFWNWNGTDAEIISTPGDRLTLTAKATGLRGTLQFSDPLVEVGKKLSLLGWALLLLLGLYAYSKTPVYRVALTGSIASGKSTLAKYFAEAGVAVLDFDKVAAEVRSLPQTQAKLKKKFPEAFLSSPMADTQVLRSVLQKDNQRREWFENFMHVQMRRRFEAHCGLLEAQGEKLILCEGALLVKTGYAEQFDEVIYVDAPSERRLQRLRLRNPDWSLAQQTAWISAQGIPELAGHSPCVRIENDSDEVALKKHAQSIVARWATIPIRGRIFFSKS